jgi:hypothetical protein
MVPTFGVPLSLEAAHRALARLAPPAPNEPGTAPPTNDAVDPLEQEFERLQQEIREQLGLIGPGEYGIGPTVA